MIEYRIRVRRGSEFEWTEDNPILASGELGYSTDTKKLKVGDGATRWRLLPYLLDGYAKFEVSEVQPENQTAGNIWIPTH